MYHSNFKQSVHLFDIFVLFIWALCHETIHCYETWLPVQSKWSLRSRASLERNHPQCSSQILITDSPSPIHPHHHPLFFSSSSSSPSPSPPAERTEPSVRENQPTTISWISSCQRSCNLVKITSNIMKRVKLWRIWSSLLGSTKNAGADKIWQKLMF